VPSEIEAIKAQCSEGLFNPEDTIKLARYHLAAIKPESKSKEGAKAKGLKKETKHRKLANKSSSSESSDGKKKQEDGVLSEWEH
jgi:hypothetical protein